MNDSPLSLLVDLIAALTVLTVGVATFAVTMAFVAGHCPWLFVPMVIGAFWWAWRRLM